MTSIDNEKGRASGHANVPLSESGRKLARELGQHYAAEHLDAIFCSDLQRASATAQIAFTDRALPIILDARLREFDYGVMTQYPRTQVEAEFARRIVEAFPNGESVVMAVQRVGDFLSDVLREYDGKTIVVIGHRATKYGLEYWYSNTSLMTIVDTPWEWRDIPIWRYDFDKRHLNRDRVTSN